ncbi:MAG: DUF1080 domain-containing protein [Bryobacterales bacterium]
MRTGILLLLLLSPGTLPAADWADLLGGSLKQWDVLGDGIWKLRSDGVLIAYRKPDKDQLFASSPTVDIKQFHQWDIVQSWLYTKKDYDEFDLHLDYWVRTPGNSGISIRDPSHAKYGMTHPPDFSKTPSKLGYEIQINSEWHDPWPTGSIYGLAKAKEGVQKEGEWNSLNVVSRREGIKVYVNGELVAEHAGDPKRPMTGPIGLQLHDQTSFVMFRNIFLLEH